MTGIPQRIRDMVEFPPIEDVGLVVMRSVFPELTTYSLIPDKRDPFPFILVRGHFEASAWSGDGYFVDRGVIAVHTFTEDPDGDEDGGLLSEAIRVGLRDAARAKLKITDTVHLHQARPTARPRRVSDWATSQGPVQYADLPTGTYRYETLYRVVLRRQPA